jgi:hypothetical protein
MTEAIKEGVLSAKSIPAARKSRRAWIVIKAALRLMALLLELAVASGSVVLCYIMAAQPDGAFLNDLGHPTGPPRWVFLFWLVVSTALVIFGVQAIARWWRQTLADVPIVRRPVSVMKSAGRALWVIAALVVGGFMVWTVVAGILLPDWAPQEEPISLKNAPIEDLLIYLLLLAVGALALSDGIGSIYKWWRVYKWWRERPSLMGRASP